MTLGTGPIRLPSGGLMQSGLPMVRRTDGRPHGLLIRGCVVATYVIDSDQHPAAGAKTGGPTAVYCDVLAYTGMAGSKYFILQHCLVSQRRGGMQSDQVWKPRAASFDVTGGTGSSAGQPGNFDPNSSNPANLDGDHVLVGFLDNSFNQPIILRGVPHPSTDLGNTALTAGHRVRLKVADGDPDFLKHHGSYFGITSAGDFVADTTLANDGKLQGDGKEAAAPADGSKGNHLYRIQRFAKRMTEWVNSDTPASPAVVMREMATLSGILVDFMANTPSLEVKGNDGNLLKATGSGSNSSLKVGDGAMHVAISEALESLWGQLQTYLDTHVHQVTALASPTGPPSAPPTLLFAPSFASAIKSSKVSIPNG